MNDMLHPPSWPPATKPVGRESLEAAALGRDFVTRSLVRDSLHLPCRPPATKNDAAGQSHPDGLLGGSLRVCFLTGNIHVQALDHTFRAGLRPVDAPKTISLLSALNGKKYSYILDKPAMSFWHPDGTPMSSPQFLALLYGKLPDFFQSEAELRNLWSAPDTRAKLLERLAESGFGHDQLAEMQKIIEAEKSDLFDVLAYVAYKRAPLTRETRASQARVYINSEFHAKQRAFLDFVLSHYVTSASGWKNSTQAS